MSDGPPINPVPITQAELGMLEAIERENLANVNRPIEDFSERELDEFTKEELIMTFGPKGVSFKNKNEHQLRKVVKELREHKLRLLAAHPPRPPVRDVSTRANADSTSANSSIKSTNNVDDNKSTNSRGTTDPPEGTSTADNVANTPRGGGDPSASPNMGNITDLSAIFAKDLEELGLSHLSSSPEKPITYGDLCRLLDAREMARDSALATNLSAQFDSLYARLSGTPDRQPAPSARRNLVPGFTQSTPQDPAPTQSDGQGPSTTLFRGRQVNVRPVSVGFAPSATTIDTPRASNRAATGGDGSVNSTVTTAIPPNQRSPPVQSPYSTKLNKGTSPTNDPKRGKYFSHYLKGEDGVQSAHDEISEAFLLECGFGIDIHGEVISGLSTLLEDWKVPDVNPKYLDTSFTKLDDLDVVTFTEWYKTFGFELRRYHIGLIDFDHLLLKYAHVGLSYPGVGNNRYLQMAQPMYAILIKLLPDHPIVTECKKGLSGFHHDGYKLLDSIMARALPVFNPSIAMFPPRWEDYKNVHEMAQRWQLYFRYQAKIGAYFSPIDRSNLYLSSLQEHSLLGMVMNLKGSIELYRNSVDEFDVQDVALPTHLTIDGILNALTSTTSPLDTSLTFSASSTRALVAPRDMSLFGSMNATGRRATRRGGVRSVSPVKPKLSLRCRACGKKNHDEANCHELAKMLILTERIKTLKPDLKQRVVDSYRRFYGDKPSPALHSTYAAKLADLCTEHDVSESELEAMMDWKNFCAEAEAEDIGVGSSSQDLSE